MPPPNLVASLLLLLLFTSIVKSQEGEDPNNTLRCVGAQGEIKCDSSMACYRFAYIDQYDVKQTEIGCVPNPWYLPRRADMMLRTSLGPNEKFKFYVDHYFIFIRTERVVYCTGDTFGCPSAIRPNLTVSWKNAKTSYGNGMISDYGELLEYMQAYRLYRNHYQAYQFG